MVRPRNDHQMPRRDHDSAARGAATCRRVISSAMTPGLGHTSQARLVAFALELEAPGGAALGESDRGAQATLVR